MAQREAYMRNLVYTERRTSNLFISLGLAIVTSSSPSFAQQTDDKSKVGAFESVKRILKQHKAELLQIPDIGNIKISRTGASFAFSIFVGETAPQEKIPKSLDGIPVSVIVQKTGLPASAIQAYQKAKAVRDKYQLSKIGLVSITGQPGGGFMLVVAADSPRAQEEVPKSLDGIPVRVYVRAEEPEMADPAYRRMRAIQARYVDHLFEYEGVVGFGISREGLLTRGLNPEGEDAKTYVFFIDVKEQEDLLYVPKEIEGVKVISRATGGFEILR